MAVLPADDIILPRDRAGGGVSLSCPALAGEEDKRFRSRGKCERMRNNERHERNDRHESLASKKKGGGAPRSAPTGPHRQAMRRAPSLPSSHCGRTEAQAFIEPWTSKNGAGALAFRRPTAASEVFALGSAQAALPGTTGCKREDPLRHQCSEHLAVRHAPDGTMPKPPVSAVYGRAAREPLPLRPKEYPRERRPFASGI